jgi:hypothetical protein
MASLQDAPGDAEALEQHALDGLRALLEVLEPQAEPAPSPHLQPVQTPQVQPAPVSPPSGRRRFWRIVEVVAALLAVALSAFILVRLYGLRLSEAPEATAVTLRSTRALEPWAQRAASEAVSTPTHALAMTATTHPPQPPATSTPRPTPTIPAPVVVDIPARDGPELQAEMLQVMDVSGALCLELQLTAMTETVQLVEGMPVLQPVLPSAGGGLHRGSAPFGGAGTTVIAIPSGTTPDSVWRIRPGDRLIGCNTNGACHDYRVAAAEMWPLARLRQLLATWSPDEGVLLYMVLDVATAWVVQAEPLREEGTR